MLGLRLADVPAENFRDLLRALPPKILRDGKSANLRQADDILRRWAFNESGHAMKLRVIEGGLSSTGNRNDQASDCRSERGDISHEDIGREAARRLGASGYHRYRILEAAGVPMPPALRYLAMQIGFAADAIGRLDPIPVDFRSDLYWPKLDDTMKA